MNIDELQDLIDEYCHVIYIICDIRIDHISLKDLTTKYNLIIHGFSWRDKSYIGILKSLINDELIHSIGLCTSHLDIDTIDLYTFNKNNKKYEINCENEYLYSQVVIENTIMNADEYNNYKIMKII